MAKQIISSDQTNQGGFKKAGRIGLAELNNFLIGLTNPAVVLCPDIESGDDNQISVLEQAVNSLPKNISMYVLEKEGLAAFAQAYRVKGFPTYLLFVSGSEKDRFLGKADQANLAGFIKKHIPL